MNNGITPVVVVRGLSGACPGPWQSIWQSQEPSWRRFSPRSWDHPDLDVWRNSLDQAVDAGGAAAVLLAHSLGCTLALDFVSRRPELLAGLSLVAPPDSSHPHFPKELEAFADVADSAQLPCQTVVATSADDPYCSAASAARLVACWNARHISLGAAGYVNVLSGHGAWPEGRQQFQNLLASEVLNERELP